MIQKLLSFNSEASSIGFPMRAILKVLILLIALTAGAIFLYCTVEKAIRLHIGPRDNSALAELGDTLLVGKEILEKYIFKYSYWTVGWGRAIVKECLYEQDHQRVMLDPMLLIV